MQRKFAGCRNEGGTHQTQNGTNEQRSPKQKRKTKGKSNNKNCHKSFAIFICFFALRFFAKFSLGLNSFIFLVPGLRQCVSSVGGGYWGRSKRVAHLCVCVSASVCECQAIKEYDEL